MESEFNTPSVAPKKNNTFLIIGGILVFLCLCLVCIGAGIFLYTSNSVPGFSSAEPTPFPTFAMPTIPPVPTSAVLPTSESSSLFEPSPVSNLRTANDQEGNDPNITFGSLDTIYLVGCLLYTSRCV